MPLSVTRQEEEGPLSTYCGTSGGERKLLNTSYCGAFLPHRETVSRIQGLFQPPVLYYDPGPL